MSQVAKISGPSLTISWMPLTPISRSPPPKLRASRQTMKAAIATMAATVLNMALEPLSNNPELRNAILDVRRSYEQTIDEVSKDEVDLRRTLGGGP